MSLDWQMFEQMEAGRIGPTVRVYTWSEPGVTCGYLTPLMEASDQCEPLLSPLSTVERGDARAYPQIEGPLRGVRSYESAIRRPTGGGIVFHDISEVAYCLVAPNDPQIIPRKLTDAYLMITRIICEALQELGFPVDLQETETGGLKKQNRTLCFARAESYEIMLNEEKVVGSAQRRTRKTVLQQGTIKTGALV